MPDYCKIIKEIERINHKLGVTLNTQSIVNLLNNGNKKINIAVLGQFKAGKSSFLNSFIGKEVLPTGVVPVTSVITQMKYRKNESAKIHFINNEIAEIKLDEIDGYVTEKNNPENLKNVFVVDLELPQLEQFSNFQFIDTPGIGSIFKHNTETTENWFSEIGLAIVTISAERPLGENEISLVKEISNHCPEIVILLNKVDLFTKEQIAEIIEYVKNNLKKEFNRDFKVYCYSSIKDGEDYRERIKSELLMPLINGFENEYNKIVSHKTNSLVKTCLGYLEIAQKTAQNSELENLQLKEQIFEEQLNNKFIYKELQIITENLISKTRDNVYITFAAYQKELIINLRNEFKSAYAQWNENLDKTARKYEAWIKERLTKELLVVYDNEIPRFMEMIEESKKHYSFYTKSFRERLSSAVERVLQVKILPEDWQIEIKPLKKPDISISYSFDIHIDIVWFLFPMFIFKNIFGRHFINQIDYEVDKNIYRLTSDTSERINKSVDEMRLQVLKYFSNELSTIESILSNSKINRLDFEEDISILQKYLIQ